MDPLRPPHPTISVPVTVAAAFTALAVAMGIGRFAFTPVLPMMEDDAGLTVVGGGWLAAANYAGYLVGALTALGGRFEAGRAVRGGLLVTGLATVAMGLSNSFVVWLALRAIAGIASAWALIFASAWTLDILARAGQRGMTGVAFGGVGGGIAGAGLLCAGAIAMGAGSDTVWIALGALALIATAALWPVFRDGAGRPQVAAPGRFRWSADAIRLALCYGALGMAYIIPATFLPSMAKMALGDPLLFRWAWPIFGAASLAGTIAAGRWQVRLGNRRLWQMSHVAMAAGVVLPVFSLGFAGIIAGALLVGGSFMVGTMTAIAEARDVGGPHAERFIAAMTAAFAIGQIVGPIAVSALVTRIGTYTPALIVAGVLLLVSAAALTAGSRPVTAAVPTGGER
jgi:MFS family permease